MKLDLSEEEFDEVVREIAERVKDLIYMNLEERIRETLRDILKREFDENDSITFKWVLKILFNDIVQIVGRLRR